MSLDADDLSRLRNAYQILGVPLSSAALEIKREFRRLAKTWHPDKWPAGSPQQAKAADRMRELNLAFDAIRHAPSATTSRGIPGSPRGRPRSRGAS